MASGRWEEEFIGYAASPTVILICTGSVASRQLALMVLRRLRAAEPLLQILLLSPPGSNVWPEVQQAGASWSNGVVQSIEQVFHIGMNLGGGGVCIPDGGRVGLADGRQYYAAHIVLCQSDVRAVSIGHPSKHGSAAGGQHDAWLRCIDSGECNSSKDQPAASLSVCVEREIQELVDDMKVWCQRRTSKL